MKGIIREQCRQNVLFQGYDTTRAPRLEASLSSGKPRSTHFIYPLARDEVLGQTRPRLEPRPQDHETDPDRNRTHDLKIASPRADVLRYPAINMKSTNTVDNVIEYKSDTSTHSFSPIKKFSA